MGTEIEDARDMELTPLEYMLQLGAQGRHILFDIDQIREAFSRRTEDVTTLDEDKVPQVREAINQVFTIPDFEGKKEYIASLPREIQHVMIYLYFQMIEKTLLSNQPQH